jgi:Putative beta-barrel porin-2, OmpL-like. bbp2
MFGLKRLRFVDLGTGLSMMIGTAGLLAASALQAAEPGCCAPAACRPTIQGGGCCDKLYEDAAARLRNMNHGCSAPAACAAPATTCTDPAAVFNGCGSASAADCSAGCGLLSGDLGEPFTLVSLFDNECGGNRLTDKGWTIGGHTQYGWQSNPDGAFAGNGTAVNQPEYRHAYLNQAYLYAAKVADGSKGFDWGFRADVLFGVDGRDAQSFGNKPTGSWDFNNGFDHGQYSWAFPQLYGEVAMGDLSTKVGHFYTPIGYEVVPSNGNFFLSRQLTFYNSEPFTHTGTQTTYKANDKLTLNGGYVFGMDSGFERFNDAGAFLGGATYVMNDKTTLIYQMLSGNLGWRGNGSINSIVLTRKWTDKFSTVHQFDVLGTDLAGADFNNQFGIAGDSVGLINYGFYDITSKLKAGYRNEWYKADGTSYYTNTIGVNVKPTANLTIRPEVRYMNSPGNEANYVGPQFNGQLYNQTVYGVDAILTF